MDLNGTDFVIINQLMHMQCFTEESCSVSTPLDVINSLGEILVAEYASKMTCILVQTFGKISEPIPQPQANYISGEVLYTKHHLHVTILH